MKPELARKIQEVMNARDEVDHLQSRLAIAIDTRSVEEATWLSPGVELSQVLEAMLTASPTALKADFTRIRTKLRDTLVQELRKTDRYLQDKLNSL